MSKDPKSETKMVILQKMQAFWDKDMNQAVTAANSFVNMMRTGTKVMLLQMTSGDAAKELLAMNGEVQSDLVAVGGRLTGFGDALAAIIFAASVGNDPKEVVGAISDFVVELREYNLETLKLNHRAGDQVQAIVKKIVALK